MHLERDDRAPRQDKRRGAGRVGRRHLDPALLRRDVSAAILVLMGQRPEAYLHQVVAAGHHDDERQRAGVGEGVAQAARAREFEQVAQGCQQTHARG